MEKSLHPLEMTQGHQGLREHIEGPLGGNGCARGQDALIDTIQAAMLWMDGTDIGIVDAGEDEDTGYVLQILGKILA